MLGDDFDPSGLTALVVDENHFERGISLDQLRATGFGRAMGAANTMEGWDLLIKINPDLVFLEWIGGSADELNFVRRVRQSPEVPNRAASVFMLTARGALGDVEIARRAGVDGYLRKPISGLALQERVRFVITRPQPFIVTPTYVGPCRRRRADPAFAGPWRRLDDIRHAQVEGDEAELEMKAQLGRTAVAALEARARDLVTGDAAAARDVFRAVRELVEVGEQIGDASLSLGAREMTRYLQAQGATDRLDPEVVRTHVAALHQLVHLPHALGQERQRVAHGLKKMVDKKLRHVDAA
jgi:DNA-binding response OmpR family regulator